MAPLRSIASVDTLPHLPRPQHSFLHKNMPPLPQQHQQPTHFAMAKDSVATFSHPSPAPSPPPSQGSMSRRSMSPMNGAASAMRNFLLRRRGTSTSSISTKSDVVNRSHLRDNLHESPSSSPMQHFVFVGGYGVVPGTTTVIYDSDIAVSEANTPTVPDFRSSIFMAGPGTNSSIVSMGDYDYALMAATTASLGKLEAEATQSFPRAMTTSVSRGRAPSLSNSSRTSHSRHASMMSDVNTTSTATTSTTTLGATSAYKNSGRKSLSFDSLRAGKSNTASKAEKDGGEAVFSVDPFMEPSSVGPLDILNDSEEGGKDEQCMDIWSGSMNSELSWSLDATDLPADSFKLQFRLDDVQYEAQQKELHEQQQLQQQLEQQRQWQWQQQQQQQKEEQEQKEQEQLRKQQLEKQQQQLYQNSVSLLLAGKLISSNKKMTASNSKNSSATDSSNNKSTKPRHHPSEAGLSDKAEVPSGTDFQATEEAVEAVEKEIMVLRSKEIVIPQSNIIEAALPLTSSSDSVAVVSSNSSPTQFYDSLQTRHALRTFLTNTERQFDEMVEYGFPCKQAAKNYRYLTLRITLTPWHARADEAKLYGASASMPGKQTQFKAMVNKFFSRSGGAYVAPATTSSLPPSQRARPSGAPRAYSDQSLRSPRRTDSLSSDKTNPRGAASPVPTGSERSRRHGRDYSYAKQLQAEEMNGSSPIPSQPQPQTQKQERRSSRYPHQLHALHQEQVRREQQLQLQAPMPQTLLRTSSRSDASLVSPPYPAPPSRSSSVSAIDETVEHVYECYQIVGAENIYKVGSQQQQERARSVTPMRQGSDSPPTYSRWMADRPLSMGPPPPLMPPPPPPRVNSKNRRRRALTIATGAAHPAGSVADAVAATASLAAIAKAAQFRTSQYCPPPQLLSTPYEDQEDSNQYDQEAEAYFETSMDFHNQEHKEVGEVDGEDYHYNRQESVEAVQAGGCWRPIQNRQTAAMKTYAFP